MKEYQGVQIVKLIEKRVKSESGEHHVELAAQLLKDMIANNVIERSDVSVLIYVTQSPMFMTPSSTFYVHKQLEFEKDCFQYDINQGGSGFVTGIQLTASLLLGFSDSKKAVVLFGDNHVVNSNGEQENIAVATILSKNKKSNLRIVNCSVGDKFHLYYKKDKNDYNLCEGLCLTEVRKRITELVGTITTEQTVDIENIQMDDSSVRVPCRLIEKQLSGDSTICAVGAGLSIVIMNCELQSSIY